MAVRRVMQEHQTSLATRTAPQTRHLLTKATPAIRQTQTRLFPTRQTPTKRVPIPHPKKPKATKATQTSLPAKLAPAALATAATPKSKALARVRLAPKPVVTKGYGAHASAKSHPHQSAAVTPLTTIATAKSTKPTLVVSANLANKSPAAAMKAHAKKAPSSATPKAHGASVSAKSNPAPKSAMASTMTVTATSTKSGRS